MFRRSSVGLVCANHAYPVTIRAIDLACFGAEAIIASMALFHWLLQIPPGEDLASTIEPAIQQAGLVLDAEHSTTAQIVAHDPIDAGVHHASRVLLMISWTNRPKGELVVEVRSAEPMLKRQTRCEQVSAALQRLLPAQSTSAL